jgi:hypothetical protein
VTQILTLCAYLALCVGGASAAEERLKPFVLASRASGDVETVAEQAKAKLTGAGFQILGSYSPYPDALVVAVTSEQLKSLASQNAFGGYAAAQRVTVTRVGDEVQVAYTNPVYISHGYRLKADLAPVAAKLESALGRIEEYGSAGKTPGELRDYHYMWGMEYFDNPSKLGKFESHEAAVKAIDAGLAAGRGGAKLVYKVALPAGKETLYGVALSEGCSGDAFVMKEIDARPVRSTGHLPYEILVSGNQAYALYARFRIAINFTDLKMMGSNSFMNIRCAPDAIQKALRQVVGGN